MNINRVIKKGLALIQPTKKLYAKVSYLSPNSRLKGKKIIITGGGKGLGKAMAKKFTSEGASVLITGRDERSLQEVSQEVGCIYLPFDVTNFSALDGFIQEADNKLGGTDVLVNNAGLSLHEGNIDNVSIEQFDAQIDTNLKASYFLSQKFLQHYFKTGKERGCILFITSERGDYVDDIPYGLTKASINSLVKGLAKLYIKKNIRINALGPGVTASAMTGREVGGDMYAPNYSTGRTYQPEEVAEVACFLISDAAACISGQIILCNNGNSINSYKKSL